MTRKLAIIPAAVLLLMLAGCGSTLEQAAVERDKCHAVGGTFTMGLAENGGYWTLCNLSDGGK